ncbi:hypothetical protein D3C83_61040 [compost metagenome]
MIVTTIGFVSPLRTMVSMICVLGLPRMRLTASVSVMPLTEASSSLTIRSPGLMPAREAGVSSMGAITLTNPSSIPTSIPRPPNSPWVPTCNSLNASWSR